ncbi:thiosulfate:glutathione sulfurtransferase isoform X6 [Odocoileus virginianus]|uniref:Thiosulfate:glutathione sulfurtransferase isoform X6 n=1 Tax=Odocoileus virginianus TaxID=9874 RepID=A0ABM4I7F0_ODOVR
MSPTASTWAGPMCHWPSTPAIARISLASVRSTGNRCGGGCAGGGAFASGSGGSRLICSFRRAGEMLPAPRGRAGAKFLKLTFAVRTMAGVSELESALQMEPAAFKALYSAEKPKLEENLIFFCQMGKRGLQATQLAQSLGYKGARNYEGAYREWLQKEG